MIAVPRVVQAVPHVYSSYSDLRFQLAPKLPNGEPTLNPGISCSSVKRPIKPGRAEIPAAPRAIQAPPHTTSSYSARVTLSMTSLARPPKCSIR